jgi:propanediol dehydratase large subunit
MALRRLPAEVARVLTVAADPVRLGVDAAGIHRRGPGDTEASEAKENT